MVRARIRRWLGRKTKAVVSRPRLRVQYLESREVPTVYIVSNQNDLGSGSLRQAILDANASPNVGGPDIVEFKASVFTPNQLTIALTSGELAITDTVNVVGPDMVGVAISGSGNHRVFSITNGATATMTDLVITNGLAKVDNGGGLLVNGAVLQMTDCTVTANSASFDMIEMKGGLGGGIHVTKSSSLTLTDCQVTSNIAQKHGGGISADEATVLLNRASEMTAGCLVSSNKATVNGAGIYQIKGSLTVNNSVVGSNSCQFGAGGGVYADQAKVDATASTFNFNHANSDSASIDTGLGGGLWLNGPASVTLTNTTIDGNKAGWVGGGIYQKNVTLTADSTTISNNESLSQLPAAKLGGGGIHAVDGSASLTTCSVSGNTAAIGNGGGIFAYTVDLTIGNSTVTSNTANDGSPSSHGLGGGIFFDGDTSVIHTKLLSITSSSINLNTADISGGGLFSRFNKTATIKNTLFDDNDATGTEGGGGIFFQSIDTCTIEDSTFTGNSTGGEGGGIFGNGLGKFTLKNSTISKNTAADSGGGIFASTFSGDSEVHIDSCSIEGNTASIGDGGGVVIDTSPKTSIRNTTIADNEALNGVGGGLYYPNGVQDDTATFNVRNSTIAFNEAMNGGGVAINGSATTPNTKAIYYNCTIASNKAVGDPDGIGGGFYLFNLVSDSDKLILDSTIVANNQATADGNDIFEDGDGLVQCPHSLIESLSGFTLDATNITPNKNGLDPNLDPVGLAKNGGNTRTIRLLTTSQAIDTGRNELSLTNDQRGSGFARVVLGKFDPVNNPSNEPRADIGAFELQKGAQVTSLQCFGGTGANNDLYYTKNHSRVTHLELTFNQDVTLAGTTAEAFVLTQESLGSGTVTLNSVQQVDPNKFVFTFADHTEGGGSLVDGIYKLTIVAGKVLSFGAPLDGNGDNVTGDDFVSPTGSGTPANIVYRLFGDGYLTGDRFISAQDFQAFYLAYGGPGAVFDFNGDGNITPIDFNEFRLRYGMSI